MRRRLSLIIIFTIIPGFWLFYLYLDNSALPSIHLSTSSTALTVWLPKNKPVNSPFPLVAKSGILIDRESGRVIYERDSNKVLPIASLTKIMTALVVMDTYEEFDKDLFYKMLLLSNNKAAEDLAGKTDAVRKGFIQLMNQRAINMGLYNTHYEDVTGLSEHNVSTAREIALLLKYVSDNKPELMKVLGTKKYKKFENTNELLGLHGIIAGKTGYTDEAGQCLGLITDKYISVVLSADDRFEQSAKLIEMATNKSIN